jgi:hypothetical protein
MRHSPFVFVLVSVAVYLAVGCPAQSDNNLPELAPIGVSTLAVCRSPEHYTNKRIRVLLTPNSYRVTPEGIRWADGFPTCPDLVFQCGHKDSTKSLDIIGTCRGKVGGVVLVTDCEVNIIPLAPYLRAASARP